MAIMLHSSISKKRVKSLEFQEVFDFSRLQKEFKHNITNIFVVLNLTVEPTRDPEKLILERIFTVSILSRLFFVYLWD